MWEKELHVARQAALAAGEVLNRTFGHVHQIIRKGEIDLVTNGDIESEGTILRMLKRRFPLDSVLSEEAGNYKNASNRKWVIDPLDGTTNFAHGFPFFAISIALEIDQETVLGLVYNPRMGESFEAVKGEGAYLNKNPIRVSATAHLGEALLGTGFPYDIHKNANRVMDLFTRMVAAARGVRRPGSAALDLCYVAAGRFDGFWEQGLKPWDTAAGALIVEEAGGKLTNYRGEPYTPYMETILAGNPLIHTAMMTALFD